MTGQRNCRPSKKCKRCERVCQFLHWTFSQLPRPLTAMNSNSLLGHNRAVFNRFVRHAAIHFCQLPKNSLLSKMSDDQRSAEHQQNERNEHANETGHRRTQFLGAR